MNVLGISRIPSGYLQTFVTAETHHSQDKKLATFPTYAVANWHIEKDVFNLPTCYVWRGSIKVA